VTVLEVIQRSAEFLGKKGVESPRLQVELLLAHVLKLPRMGLYLNFERALTEPELGAVRELVRRRAQREPLQHITGSTSFCGLELAVSGKVLTPRPETEMLAEMGWTFLNERGKKLDDARPFHEAAAVWQKSATSPQPSPPEAEREKITAPGIVPRDSSIPAAKGKGSSPAPLRALDFGTGSGCLAIALAVKCPEAKIVAIDVCPEALAVARQNAERHKATIEFCGGDGFAAIPAETRFDLIMGNPPYIPSAEIAELEPEVREHDPRLALDGGVDGLDFYRRLAREAGAFLTPDGRMMLEFGDGQDAALRKIFEEEKWVVEAVRNDYSGRARIVVVGR